MKALEKTVLKLIETFEPPLHIIFCEQIKANYDFFKSVLQKFYPNSQICFAVKSNPCRGAIRYLSSLGCGMDVVSEFELQTALEEHVPPDRIVCNGNSKNNRYIDLIVANNLVMVADCLDELEYINAIAEKKKSIVSVLVRIAGMPLTGLTSADQSTATPWTKFGFPVSEIEGVFRKIQDLKFIDYYGLSAHIGTQICDAAGFDILWKYIVQSAKYADQCGLTTKAINIGGGYPLSYVNEQEWRDFQKRLEDQLKGYSDTPEWVTWDNQPLGYARSVLCDDFNTWYGKTYWSEYQGAQMLDRILTYKNSEGINALDYLNDLGNPRLVIEPGRALIGNSGITVARVNTVKTVMGNNVVSVDLGINNHGTNLITPDYFTMTVLPLKDDDVPIDAFVAGRLCFTGDMISKLKVKLNRKPKRGQILIIHNTGAYSADHFASHSCGFPLPAKVAVQNNGSIEIWRKPEKYGDVFGAL